ncbi:DUF423 domain-containing protein [Mongoliitalea daihaiensis]|uniref:DUF423 domain-containing protein n=1 Tax=Mongoliitalea daihaiensis TaxID=2782006 RepID=UPI001F1BFC4B|nr:DUF423 domain-containing protein [Mongoliitalea daihaiensis]UJP63669.1 DUF423 domain-containing protein [Mongoliitalea daihaiensis]
MNKHSWITVASLMLALAVGIGAFGAHGLQPILEANGRLETFETAVKYHFYHALGILVLAIWNTLQPTLKNIKLSYWLLVIGILIFSGSLYVLSITGITWLGAITPLGGVAFIAGWLNLIRVKA